MPDLPEGVVREATEAYRCAVTSGISKHVDLVRIVLEAAARFEDPLGEPYTVPLASKLPEEAVAAGIPAAAIDALARTLYDYEDTDDDEITWEGYRPDAKGMLDILAPILAAQARADERRKVAEEIREIVKDGGPMPMENWRAFKARHKRLVTGDSVVAVLLAVADEIEREDR